MFESHEFEKFSWSQSNNFAVECDWNRKFPNYVRNSFFLERNVELFFKKFNFINFFSKNGWRWQISVQCVSNDIFHKNIFFQPELSIFLQKLENSSISKKYKNLLKIVFLKNKRFHLSERYLSLAKLEGGKYTGGGRPSCLASTWKQRKKSTKK